MRDIYEHVFQFVKKTKYYFDGDSIRIVPEKDAHEKDGQIISATGVSGKKYYRQIKTSTVLSEEEKTNALNALNETLEEMRSGEVVDFRMTIRGEQRTYPVSYTHLDPLHQRFQMVSGESMEPPERFLLDVQFHDPCSRPGCLVSAGYRRSIRTWCCQRKYQST